MNSMKCINPYTSTHGQAFGCGQCRPCRLNKRRVWAHRIMLEALQHKDNAFVTLTYSDDKLPPGDTVVPRDLQLFMKRLRKHYEPFHLRFFAVGEYGDTTQRPHYHLALFGYPTCRFGQSQYAYRVDCCASCDAIRSIWNKGNVFLGTLEPDSAQYIAGYVVKKMTSADDDRLNGRHPEFARMSNRPGIGGDAVYDLADVIMRYELDDKFGDVPAALRHGGKELPLGRYLMRRLRESVGRDAKAPQSVIDKVAEEMRPLREAARNDPNDPSFRSKLIQRNEPYADRLERLSHIYKKERKI